jgi:hypothetical protein
MKNLFFLFAICVLAFSSCMKEEIPVSPHAPGELESKQVELGIYYSDQVWYNIENGMEVARNHKTAWDLAFENNGPGSRITINSANIPYIAKTNETDITLVKDTTGATWYWDEFSGNLDSTAIGDWAANPQIYLLNRGKDEFGKPLGISKLFIDSTTDNNFYFRYAELSSDVWSSGVINKDSDYFYSYFSLKGTGSQVQIAPPAKDWDVLFSQYTFVFYDMVPIVPYLVTGVILNPNDPYSLKVFDKNFEAISREDIMNPKANERIDNIGYNFKWYDFDAGYYITDPSKNYIFRNQQGKMFKIHFLDWYNQAGEKGSPSFEYSEL